MKKQMVRIEFKNGDNAVMHTTIKMLNDMYSSGMIVRAWYKSTGKDVHSTDIF